MVFKKHHFVKVVALLMVVTAGTPAVANASLPKPCLADGKPCAPEHKILLREDLSQATLNALARSTVGYSAAVWHEGKVAWTHAGGLAKQASGQPGSRKYQAAKPAQDETIYRLASLSKPITAVAALMLVDQGQFSLDEPLSHWLSELDQGTGSIKLPAHYFGMQTARQILLHTAGFGHYRDYPASFHAWSYKTQVGSAKEALPKVVQAAPVNRTQSVSYSTHSFTALAAAMESASGRTFPRIMSGVFRAAQVSDLGLVHLPTKDERWAAWQERRATLYEKNKKEDKYLENVSWKWAGGGMEGTAAAVATFWGHVISGQVLKPESLALLFTPGTGSANTRTHGFRNWPTSIEHGGSQEGTSSYVLVSKDRRTVVVVLTNTHGLSPLPKSAARAIGPIWNSTISAP